MESGTFVCSFNGDPRAAMPSAKIMLKVLAFLLAMLAASLAYGAAETDPPVAGIGNHINNKQPTPQSNSAAGASSVEDLAAENELLQLANKSRERAGAAPLRMEASLHEAARAHALMMIASERLEHQFSGEPALLQRIALAGPENNGSNNELKTDRAGENIAYADCAPNVNEVLMRSAPHRENLLDRGFNVAGIAAIWNKGRLYVVQDFAHEVPSYSAQQNEVSVGRAVAELRQQAGLSELQQLTPPTLNDAACSLAAESRPNPHLLATALAADYDNRKIVAYTESRPEVLPQGAVRLLHDPGIRQFAVGSCYARNSAYPTGTYWVAILLY
jgi:uncharacterized protein YkwD